MGVRDGDGVFRDVAAEFFRMVGMHRGPLRAGDRAVALLDDKRRTLVRTGEAPSTLAQNFAKTGMPVDRIEDIVGGVQRKGEEEQQVDRVFHTAQGALRMENSLAARLGFERRSSRDSHGTLSLLTCDEILRIYTCDECHGCAGTRHPQQPRTGHRVSRGVL